MAGATAIVLAAPAFGAAIDEVIRDGDLEVRFRVSHTAITTAERVIVEVAARSWNGVPPRIEEVGGLLGDFRVRSARIPSPRMAANGVAAIEESRWVLEPYLPGTYTIPSLKVTGRHAEGALLIETPAIAVVVSSVLPASEEPLKLRDLAPPVRDYGSWMPIIFLVIVVPPCVALVLRMLRGRERRARAAADADKPPPHEEALAELKNIRGEPGGAERLHDVFCRYLQLRFNQHTRGRSLEELSSRLDLEGAARATFEKLSEQLQQARYGKDDVASLAASSAGDLFEEFVRQTAPQLRNQEA